MLGNMQSKAKILFIMLLLAVIGLFTYGFTQEPKLLQTPTEQALDASKFGQ
jgi:uncharacterized protein YpmB